MSKSQHRTVELRIPSKLNYEKIAMETASALARVEGFSKERVEDLKTAVSEAVINAIEHGHRQNTRMKVLVYLTVDAHAIEVQIHDRGKGKTPSMPRSAPSARKKIEGQEEPRGWGLFLIKNLVDEAEFVDEPNGKYTRLVIYFNKDGAGGSAA